MLRRLGHKVSGLALKPLDGGLFSLANLETEMESQVIADIRDFEAVTRALQEAKPDFAIHMAAQPLVLRSYEDPVETYTKCRRDPELSQSHNRDGEAADKPCHNDRQGLPR